jgi:hypothetical protein
MQPRKLAPVYTSVHIPSVNGRALSLQYPTYVEPFFRTGNPLGAASWLRRRLLEMARKNPSHGPRGIIVRAEMRMADEIDKGQRNGKVASNGQHGEAVQTSDSLGIDRRLSSKRQTR